jgi:hypothetical protein
MSDFNPLTGQSSSEPAMEQREFAPRQNFDNPVAQKLDELVHSDEAAEFAHIARLASKTKFATGDLETDIRNYMKMQRIAQEIAGMLGDDES